ncbi:hypothetical protein V6615_05705 [Oscillospiraceae bacterium PP1C4]
MTMCKTERMRVMDVLLQNGDHVMDHLGAPMMVDGVRELLQRAVIRLAVRRGTMPHDPLFGSGLHRLKAVGDRNALDAQALAAVREALAPMTELGVRSVKCAYHAASERLTARVQLELYAKEYALEVTI